MINELKRQERDRVFVTNKIFLISISLQPDSLYLCNRIVYTFDISKLDYLIQQNSLFEISQVSYIWLQIYSL